MKKIIFAFLAISLFSCSSDSDNSATPSNETSDFTNALPLNNGNYWTYNVVGTATTRDSLYILGNETIGSYVYKEFRTRNNVATGFYSSALNNNNLRKDNGKLLLTGNLSLAQGQTLPVGLDLSVTDFIIFKEYATSGEVLNEKTGSFQQTVNNIPLTIEYKLKSIGGENIGNFTSNNINYTDVKSTKMVLNVKITSTITVAGVPFTTTVLSPQDVVTSTLYISKNIGMVYSNTITTYNIDAAVATQFGIPATTTQTQKEYLDTYMVN